MLNERLDGLAEGCGRQHRRFLRVNLQLGRKFTTACLGHEALHNLAHLRGANLVITDEAMPEMTGTELASQIKGQCPTLPILPPTGFTEHPSGESTNLRRLDKAPSNPVGSTYHRRAL